eukprot:SAG11_NODE_7775_length_1097_cov_1.552104_2_plen_111_part_00
MCANQSRQTYPSTFLCAPGDSSLLGRSSASITNCKLMSVSRSGLAVHGDQKGHPGDNPMKTQNGTDSHCTESVVAAFLIAVEQGAILGCNDWQVHHVSHAILYTHLLPAC